LRTHELFRVAILHVATYGLMTSHDVRFWPIADMRADLECPLLGVKRASLPTPACYKFALTAWGSLNCHLNLEWYFNDVRVRTFIPTGAPLPLIGYPHESPAADALDDRSSCYWQRG